MFIYTTVVGANVHKRSQKNERSHTVANIEKIKILILNIFPRIVYFYEINLAYLKISFKNGFLLYYLLKEMRLSVAKRKNSV